MARKKGKRKGSCPKCGVPMKLRRRYCTNCGNGNPMLVRGPVRRRPAPAAAKSAGGGYAPVVPLRTGRDPMWADFVSDNNPDTRIGLFMARFPDGGGAA